MFTVLLAIRYSYWVPRQTSANGSDRVQMVENPGTDAVSNYILAQQFRPIGETGNRAAAVDSNMWNS